MHVYSVDLSHTHLETYDSQMLETFPSLRNLNISFAGLSSIASTGFSTTPLLEVIDVTGSPLEEFPRDLLRPLTQLKILLTSNYKLCCPAALPESFNTKNCHAPTDEISSCDDLLRSVFYRGSLWGMTVLSLVGNTGSLVSLLYFQQRSRKSSFSLFVSNLNIADFVMGVYLFIVGSADQVYRGSYLWKESTWKRSSVCKAAGFLSLLTTQVSAYFICLITLDRFLALRFVLRGFRFTARSAAVLSGVAWTIAAILAVIPLLPVTSHWEFYSQNGICIPLPITRKTFKGHRYSFALMVVLNLSIFLVIAVGQVLIYRSVKDNSFLSSDNKAKDATIARRLSTVVLSDFLCWFPVGVLGLLASTGTPIPGEVNVAMAIFVLPLNSAINPFLYTLNLIMEKRRKAAESRMLRQLMAKLASERQVRHSGTMTSE